MFLGFEILAAGQWNISTFIDQISCPCIQNMFVGRHRFYRREKATRIAFRADAVTADTLPPGGPGGKWLEGKREA